MHKSKRRLGLNVSAATLAALMAPVAALAQEATYRFDIPVQDLGSALRAYGEQSNQQIVFEGREVAGRRSVALIGSYGADEGLRILLGNSGLNVRRTQAGVLVVQDPNSPTQLGAADRAAPSADPSEEIVVTGTRLRSPNRTVPVTVFDREAIDRTGYSTTQDLVESLPQNFGGGDFGGSDDGFLGNGVRRFSNFTQASSPNLRGLGNGATLTLVNGRRLAPSSFGAVVDISLLPVAAIERVDVMTDGASAIYGADAVAGVVNFILRDDFQGGEARVRYGSVTDGNRSETTGSLAVGQDWRGGNVVLALQHQEFEPLLAQDREYARTLAIPNDLMPRTLSSSGYLSAHHDLTDNLTVYADVFASDRLVKRDATSVTTRTFFTGEVESRTASLGARFQFPSDWSVDINGSISREDAFQANYETTRSTGAFRRTWQDVWSETAGVEAVANGTLFSTLAGDVNVAFGASHRAEETSYIASSRPTVTNATERDVNAVFGELYVPLIGPAHDIFAVSKLDVSIAVRYDDYSDFGETTNPRFGLFWAPWEGLGVRGSYGTSFRAPNGYEAIAEAAGISRLQIWSFANPAGSGTVPVFVLRGPAGGLRPETADVYNFGIDYDVPFAPGLRISAERYDIAYADRIIAPPFSETALLQQDYFGALITGLANDTESQAYLTNAVANGAQLVDLVGTGAAGVRYIVDLRQRNVAALHQSGTDLTISYDRPVGAGTINARLTGSWIDEVDTQLSSTSSGSDLVGTFGFPADFRARADVGYSTDSWRLNAAVNFVSSYTNTVPASPEPIDSWTTVDMAFRFDPRLLFGQHFPSDVSLGITVQNIFDEGPPYVRPSSSDSVAYDPANANGLGRFVAIDLRKRW